MHFTAERIKRILEDIYKYRYPYSQQISGWELSEYCSSEKKLCGSFEYGQYLRGKDQTFILSSVVNIGEKFEGKPLVFAISPIPSQCILYVDGKLMQGIDSNHSEAVVLKSAKARTAHSIALHVYPGGNEVNLQIKCEFKALDIEVEKLYYDIKTPYEVCI